MKIKIIITLFVGLLVSGCGQMGMDSLFDTCWRSNNNDTYYVHDLDVQVGNRNMSLKWQNIEYYDGQIIRLHNGTKMIPSMIIPIKAGECRYVSFSEFEVVK